MLTNQSECKKRNAKNNAKVKSNWQNKGKILSIKGFGEKTDTGLQKTTLLLLLDMNEQWVENSSKERVRLFEVTMLLLFNFGTSWKQHV